MKKLIEWTDDLSVGVQEIDEQHKVLVNLLNKLYEAIITSNEDHMIKSILQELIQYTVIHFAVEESLMRIFNYPNYEEHKKQHALLVEQVLQLQNNVERNESELSLDTLNFLRHWLTEHIMGEDMRYTPYLIENGVQTSWEKRSWAGRIWDSLH